MGVILRGTAKHLLNKCFPYTSGGDPAVPIRRPSVTSFSLHMWGWSCKSMKKRCKSFVFPTQVGVLFSSSTVSVLDFFSCQRNSAMLFRVFTFPYFTLSPADNLDFFNINSMIFRWFLSIRFLSFIFTFGVFLHYLCDPKRCFSVSFRVIFCIRQLMLFVTKKRSNPRSKHWTWIPFISAQTFWFSLFCTYHFCHQQLCLPGASWSVPGADRRPTNRTAFNIRFSPFH